MDAAVEAAMARWPDVPAVFDWLALDARGRWRLRTSAAPDAAFEPIANPALNAFIARNYAGDVRGRWYFQNGPQRVYVRLAAAPWILRLMPDESLVTHTAQPAGRPHGAAMDPQGRVFLATALGPAALDDRDLGAMLTHLVDGQGKPFEDHELADWLAAPTDAGPRLSLDGTELALVHVATARVPTRFGFVPEPVP